MSERFVYILSDYQEHGATNLVATLDRDKPPELAEAWGAEPREGLVELLKRPDAELATGDGWGTCRGWGGMQLHVAELR